MKNQLIVFLFLGFRISIAQSVLIDPGSTSSEMVNIKSQNKGILIPSMTSSQRTMIGPPQKGLLVFDIQTNTFWFNDGSFWHEIKNFSLPDSLTFDANANNQKALKISSKNATAITGDIDLTNTSITPQNQIGYGIGGFAKNSYVGFGATPVGIFGSAMTPLGIGVWGKGDMIGGRFESNNPAGHALRTVGNLRFEGINEGINKVLTSDNGGNATWQSLPQALGNPWTLDGLNIANNNSGNVGIGLSPLKSKFEIHTNSTTQAIFGSNGNGISIQKDYPTIGFNQYRDGNNVSKYLGSGFAGGLFQNPATGYFHWNTIPFGSGGTNTAGETNIMTLTSAGRVGIRGVTEPNADFQFPNLLGNKLNFWNDGPNNQYGIGILNSTLALYTAHSINKISFGHGSANSFNETLKIESGNGAIYSTQSPNLNIVPLGISEVWAGESDNGFDASSNHINIVGNMVVDHLGIASINIDDNLHGKFKLNPDIVSQYSKIVAIGSLNYSGGAIEYIATTAVSGYIGEITDGIVVVTTGTDQGTFYHINVVVDDFPYTGSSTLKSKVIFYGIK